MFIQLTSNINIGTRTEKQDQTLYISIKTPTKSYIKEMSTLKTVKGRLSIKICIKQRFINRSL